MEEFTAYFNGEWVPRSQVKVDPDDRGFSRADVVFDGARTFNGKGFRLRQHVDRLYRSLKYVRIDPGLSPEEMLDVHEEAIRRNEHLRAEVGDFAIRPFVTRGHGYMSQSSGPPTVCVTVAPVDVGRFAPMFKVGVHGVIPRTRSYPPESLDSKIKHYSRMNFNLAELEAADVDPEAWPILLDVDGNLTEGTTNNVFLITDGVIRSPQDRTTLQGVSRGMVFDLAHQLNIPIVEEDLQPYDLYNSDEAFFSRTGPCILPVTKVDNRVVADGKPGPITQQLLAAWSEMIGVDIVGQAEELANR